MDKLKNINWTSPITILMLVLLVSLPIVAGFYMQVGAVLGIVESLAILILLDKAPRWLQALVAKHPFAADLLLSALATVGLSSLYGHGLVIAIAAITCALILSWALPRAKPP